MEHIDTPVKTAYPPVSVPYLSHMSAGFGYIFDGGDWSSYPFRVGVYKDTILDRGDFTQEGEKTPEEIAAFLQSWLFFGLLSAIVSEPVDTGELVKIDGQGREVVTTEKLNKILERYFGRVIERYPDGKAGQPINEDMKREMEGNHQILHEAELFIANCVARNGPYRPACPLSLEVSLSILLMAQALSSAVKVIFAPAGAGMHGFLFGHSQYLYERLEEDSWCESDMEMLETLMSVEGVYYASLFGRRRFQRNHTHCNKRECLALRTDEATYKTKHALTPCPLASQGLSCDSVSAPTNDLCSILDQGGIPVVKAVPLPEGLRASTSTTDGYVAISHVWADGLGNPNENSLPMCQIWRIQNWVNTLYNDLRGPNRPFWLDTLCVPITPSGTPRKVAISRIDKTFAEAAAVLVLDAELIALKARDMTHLEVVMRIVTSGWTRRLWTLQEAFSAKRVFFQCADSAEPFNFLDERLRKEAPFKGFKGNLIYEALGACRQLGLMSANSKSESRVLDQTKLDALRWRATSHARDEIICLASLFGFTADQMTVILNTPEEGRMKKFVDMQQRFDSGLLFVDGLRMQENGYRWCPSSFMGRDNSGNLALRRHPLTWAPDSMVIKGERGLLVKFPGFRLSLDEAALLPQFYVREAKDQWFRVTYNPENAGGLLWILFGVEKLKNPAVIVLQRPTLKSLPAVIVDVESERDGVRYVSYICRVSMKAVHEGPAHLGGFHGLELRLQVNDNMALLGGGWVGTTPHGPDPTAVCRGIPLPEDTRWCLG